MSVHTGDLNKPSLGLAPEVYASLAAEVDTVVHNGALVNHAYSYQQQFEPNVLGTVEVRARGVLSCLYLSTMDVAAPRMRMKLLRAC